MFEDQSVCVRGYPRSLYELMQFSAQRISEVAELSFWYAFGQWTSVWSDIGIAGYDFSPVNVEWQAFRLAAELSRQTPAALAFERAQARSDTRRWFGCFSFDYHDRDDTGQGGVIQLVFENRVRGRVGPLAFSEQDRRRNELARLFAFLSDQNRPAVAVRGGSWLYNLGAYRRLLPPEFVATAKLDGRPPFLMNGIWGQLLDADGHLNEGLVRRFRAAVHAGRNLDDVLRALPYREYSARAPIEIFYRHYGVLRTSEVGP